VSAEIERACWEAWEQGFRAGAGAIDAMTKNPYSFNGVERPAPPPFPLLEVRLDEDPRATAKRWQAQMREFAAAWDEWAGGLR
jgi:hypothetical protein